MLSITHGPAIKLILSSFDIKKFFNFSLLVFINKDLYNNLDLFKYLREVDSAEPNGAEIGNVVTVSQIFEVGDVVDVVGKSKGKGFAGGVKRWHFRGGPKTHGQGDKWRAPGSVGQGTTPGRVRKGKKMAGHMGAKRSTEQGIKIVAIDEDRNLLFVRGSVPGAASGLVLVRKQKRNNK